MAPVDEWKSASTECGAQCAVMTCGTYEMLVLYVGNSE